MNKKQMQGLGIIVLVLALGAIVWFFRTKSPTDTGSTQGNQSSDQNTTNTNTSGQQVTATAKTWTGTLKASDNAAKGNVMLVTKDYTVYIHTSRDFSTLLGKMVSVSYTGDINNFQLQNIIAK